MHEEYVISHNTIFRTITVYKDIQYFIIYMYMSIIFNPYGNIWISRKVLIEILKVEVNVISLYLKYPSVCISKYSLQRTTVYALSAIFKIFLWLRKKTTISDSNTLRWLIYILLNVLIIPTVFFLELQSTGSFSIDK